MVSDKKSTAKLDAQIEGYRKIAGSSMQHISRRWREYAAVGASLGLVNSAEAQITHVVPEDSLRFTIPAEPGGLTSGTNIDLDGDESADILFRLGFTGSTSSFAGTQILARRVFLEPLQGIGFVGDSTTYAVTSDVPPRVFASGEIISDVPGDSFLLGTGTLSQVGFGTSAFALPGSDFPDGSLEDQDVLFGFAFSNGTSSNQYGWIRVALEASEDGRLEAAEVVEWAFQETAGVPIAAGDTGVVAPPAVDGDFNGDGDIDAEDFQEFLTQFSGDNAVVPGPELNGNANDDNLVNAADFNVFRDNFPSPPPVAATVAVPEPTSFSLGALALGAVGVSALRRRRQA